MTDESERVVDFFSLTEEEAFILAVAKYWLMASDLDQDPDLADQKAKHPVILQYGLELHRACQHELEADDDTVPLATREDILQRMRAADWPAAVRRSLGDTDFDVFDELLSEWAFVASVLKTVTSRARGVLLTVELASFYPWPPEVEYEAGVREKELADLVEAMAAPISHEYLNEIDRALATRARKLALENVDWGRLGLIAGGGAVLSLLTGGIAAPFVGGTLFAAGWGAMGYAGGSAFGEAKVALFGNPMAAGGYAAVGGTLNTGVTTADAGGSAATLNDLVKLDVLTEYLLIRERNQPGLARAVVAATEHRLRQTEAEMVDLRQQVDKLKRLAPLQAQTEQLLREREADLEAAEQALADTETAREYQEQEVARLRELLREHAAV